MIKKGDLYENDLDAPLRELRDETDKLISTFQKVKEGAVLAEKGLSMETTLNKSANAMQKVVSTSKDLENAEQNLNKAIQTRIKEEKAVIEAIEKKATADKKAAKEVKGYAEVIKELKAELKQAEANMIQAGEKSGKMSDEFQAAAKVAGQIKDRIADMKDETKAFAGGNSLENLSTRFGLLGNEVKNLNFEGVGEQVKAITALSKGMTFKESIAGLGGLTKSFGALGKVILTNPLFLIVAVIVVIIVAVVKLKDSIPFLTKAFEIVGGAIDWVIQQLKDFADWLGITTFAADEKRERIIANAKAEQEALTKRYDGEIRLAQAAGKATEEIERKKQLAIILTSKKALGALEEQVNSGKKLTEEQQELFKELTESIADAELELEVIRIKQHVEFKKREEEKRKAWEDEQKRLDEALIKKYEAEQKAAEAHNKEMEELAVRMAYRLSSEEEIYKILDGLEQEHVEKFMSYQDLMDARKQKSHEEQKKRFEEELALTTYLVDGLSKLLADSVNSNEKFIQAVTKRLFIFILDAIEKQMLAVQAASIAKMTAEAIAQPDSVATFGATGITRALILSGLIKAGFAVAKAQISKFAVGTENSPEGFAWVGEQGRELIKTPDNKVFLTPDSATLTYLPKGTVVKTNPKTEDILAGSNVGELADALSGAVGNIWEQGSQVFRIVKRKDNSARLIRLKSLSE